MFKSKKQKLEEKNIPMDSEMLNPDATVSVEFQSEAGEIAGQPVQLPCSIDRKSLQSILNLLLNQVCVYLSHRENNRTIIIV